MKNKFRATTLVFLFVFLLMVGVSIATAAGLSGDGPPIWYSFLKRAQVEYSDNGEAQIGYSLQASAYTSFQVSDSAQTPGGVVTKTWESDPDDHWQMHYTMSVPSAWFGQWITNVATLTMGYTLTDTAAVRVAVPSPVIALWGTTCMTQSEISGWAMPGSTLELFSDGIPMTNIVVPSDGQWSATPSTGFSAGTHILSATATMASYESVPTTVTLVISPDLALDPAHSVLVSPDGAQQPLFFDDGYVQGWLQPGMTYIVRVRSCFASGAYTLTMDHQAQVARHDILGCCPDKARILAAGVQDDIPLNPAGDQIYTATFTAGDDGSTVGLQGQSGGYSVAGSLSTNQDGRVQDITTGSPLPNISVTAQEWLVGNDEQLPGLLRWPADAFEGQVNPQVTGENGYFAFYAPSGLYHIVAEQDGYQPYRSEPLRVISAPLYADIYLTPHYSGAASEYVQVGALDLGEGVSVPVGSQVAWTNLFTDTLIQIVGQDGTWRSGVLWPAESYTYRFDEAGVYNYTVQFWNQTGKATSSSEGKVTVRHTVYLPLVATGSNTNMTAALLNPSFEGITCHPDSPPGWCWDNWTRDTFDGIPRDNIYTPQGWVTWWRVGSDYGQPEVKVIPNVPPFTGELPRIRSGNYATVLFTFYRNQDTGFYQVVGGLEPGATAQFSAYAHGWSCNNDDHLGYSCGDPWNQTFQVGIEPDGNEDPFSPTIVWSPEQISPDHYGLIGPITAQVGEGGRVCVFLRSKTKWAYKYQDAYWDDASLMVSSQ